MKEIMSRQIQDGPPSPQGSPELISGSTGLCLYRFLLVILSFPNQPHSQINPIPTKEKKQLEAISISFNKSIVGYFLKPVYRT